MRSFDDFLLRSRDTRGPLRVTRRNDVPLAQVLLPERVIAHEDKLRGLGFGVVNGAVDLRGREVPPRVQFGGIELHQRLPRTQFIAFLREDFCHSPAHARPHVHFIHLDRAGDGVVLALTSREQSEHDTDSRPGNRRKGGAHRSNQSLRDIMCRKR